MNKKKLIIDIILASLLLLLVLANKHNLTVPYLKSTIYTADNWQLLTHTAFNYTFWWIDFNQIFGLPLIDTYLGLAGIFIFILFAYQTITLYKSLHRFIIAISYILVLLMLFGLDGPLYLLLAQILITILAITCVNSQSTLSYMLIAACFSLFACTQASPYCIAALGISLFMKSNLLSKKITKHLPTLAVLIMLLLFFYWSLTLQISRPSLPDFGYPGTARVVPDDGLAGNITALIGESTVIPFINRAAIKSHYYYPTLVIILFALISLTAKFSRSNRLLFLFALIIAWDIIPAESLSSIGPIETIRRILPGFFPFSLTSIFFCFLLIMIWIGNSQYLCRIIIVCIMVLLSNYQKTNLLNHTKIETISKLSPVAASPSLYLINTEGSVALKKKEHAFITWKSVTELDGKINASHQTKKKITKLLSDRRFETRWSPMRGAQYGDEWLTITLPQIYSINGIEIPPGKYHSDFPRGLLLEKCDVNSSNSLMTIKSFPHWQGALNLSDNGFPYYSGQHDVSILFPEAIRANCIKVTQISESPNYDWPVSELRLLINEAK